MSKYCLFRTKDIFTETTKNIIKYKEERPILMVSSTSWTPDEDFNMLLDSFIDLEKNLGEEINKLRKVLFLITGKGPRKEAFMKRVKETNLKLFIVKSIWLESDDYPKLLGNADLGVCLHYSSSGFDLPMKVVDMFSAELPVCAIYYHTIRELVKEGKNGFLFKDINELNNILTRVIREYTNQGKCQDIDNFRENLKLKTDWITQWKNLCSEVIQKQAKLITSKY
jgi:beta-1,4-mannosyltransferase